MTQTELRIKELLVELQARTDQMSMQVAKVEGLERQVAELETQTHSPVGTRWAEVAEKRLGIIQERDQHIAELAEKNRVLSEIVVSRQETIDQRNAEIQALVAQHPDTALLDWLIGSGAVVLASQGGKEFYLSWPYVDPECNQFGSSPDGRTAIRVAMEDTAKVAKRKEKPRTEARGR